MPHTFRKLGNDDDKANAAWIASECYHQASLQIAAFVRELGGWDKLPDKFVISDGDDKGWHGAEVAIDLAVQQGDWVATWDLCAAYKARVERYLDGWRKIRNLDRKPVGV